MMGKSFFAGLLAVASVVAMTPALAQDGGHGGHGNGGHSNGGGWQPRPGTSGWPGGHSDGGQPAWNGGSRQQGWNGDRTAPPPPPPPPSAQPVPQPQQPQPHSDGGHGGYGNWNGGQPRTDNDHNDRGRPGWQGNPYNYGPYYNGNGYNQSYRQPRPDWNHGDNRWNGAPPPGGYRYTDRDRWSDQRRWDRGWRDNGHYNWRSYRNYNRDIYRLPPYRAPYGWGYGYRSFSIGIYLDSLLFDNSYWIDDPYYYHLPPAYGTLRWVRYYDDALLVDIRDGYVVDVIHNFFW